MTYSIKSQALAEMLQCCPDGQLVGSALPPTHVKNLEQSLGSFKCRGGFGVPGGQRESLFCDFTKPASKTSPTNLNILLSPPRI